MARYDPYSFRGRLLATLRLQFPDALDPAGGFRLLDPERGEPDAGDRRHLVATCRSIANFAAGAVAGGPDWCIEATEHGIAFLESAHRADATDRSEGYRLVVESDGSPVDRTRSAYGHAFVLLAYARATAAGVDGAARGLDATVDLLDARFRDGTGCLRSDCGPDWVEREAYRGQNANMHACEAFLAAYEATGENAHLDRARRIAERLTVELAAETDGLLWEHYGADWTHDFGYNADEPRHRFRPPGYQPGHHVEWAKLCALLDRYDATAPAERESVPGSGDWYDRAVALFDAGVDLGWTDGGFAYTVERDGRVIVGDRYGWALAEGIGAAAALAERATRRGDGEAAGRFREWRERFVDRADAYRGPAGLWYEKRPLAGTGGDPVPPEPPGVEPDYHPASAYFESWRSGVR
ncbi:mannose/cellobiose epimerase-like protein (N-acyl-D-glucosamine 2-epimerase family) [Halorubrum trapanicum]|uniref:Mannose/cellobiose epimerase-like protein (N-acyl-D-glucosamine 2-epimerase family) n=1 Tax=Halorubrum trapanicum TaxID=29284 RepID=A0A8J7RNU8_9EURY|nr:AGE family epimerase/isomerase [Halorubrum trapanicum]MBP1900567.1 mannose/cellobiose epimerase-like protein (N-acyl-D-glucosamine 2-epimerase family) [Halorubrum trapanicum]